MNQIETVKKICGILMAGGAAVLMFMISGLIHKAGVIGADALDAAIHNREKKDKRLLLYTGISNTRAWFSMPYFLYDSFVL